MVPVTFDARNNEGIAAFSGALQAQKTSLSSSVTKALVHDKTGEDVQRFLLSDDRPIAKLDYLAGSRLQLIVYQCTAATLMSTEAIQMLQAFYGTFFLYEIASKVMKYSV